MTRKAKATETTAASDEAATVAQTTVPDIGSTDTGATDAPASEGAADKAAPTQSTPAPADDLALTVVVTGPRAGRRRAGRHFGPEPVTIPAAELSEDQMRALLADPELMVKTIALPA